MSNCEFCHKVLSKEKGEEDHGCLDCAGYIYIINDVHVCFHCIEIENRILRDENERLQNYVIAGYKEMIDELEAENAKLNQEIIKFEGYLEAWGKDE